PIIKRSRDRAKDQTYVLWGIPLETLRRTLFPIGELTKTQVRKTAADAGLITASEPESQDICFIPNHDYRGFLRSYVPQRVSQDLPGRFISPEGESMGRHRGLSQYTVGQRRGLGVTGPRPLYVQRIDPQDRTVTLTTRDRMLFDGCTVDNLNWLQSPENTGNGQSLSVHIRYNHPGVSCRITPDGDSRVRVIFSSPQFAVTPGQSAVFYAGDELLGGGIILEGRLHD
ncbi:MAG: MnmA/TRMU family protein, partial [Fidelibacterota bacterium]